MSTSRPSLGTVWTFSKAEGEFSRSKRAPTEATHLFKIEVNPTLLGRSRSQAQKLLHDFGTAVERETKSLQLKLTDLLNNTKPELEAKWLSTCKEKQKELWRKNENREGIALIIAADYATISAAPGNWLGGRTASNMLRRTDEEALTVFRELLDKGPVLTATLDLHQYHPPLNKLLYHVTTHGRSSQRTEAAGFKHKIESFLLTEDGTFRPKPLPKAGISDYIETAAYEWIGQTEESLKIMLQSDGEASKNVGGCMALTVPQLQHIEAYLKSLNEVEAPTQRDAFPESSRRPMGQPSAHSAPGHRNVPSTIYQHDSYAHSIGEPSSVSSDTHNPFDSKGSVSPVTP